MQVLDKSDTSKPSHISLFSFQCQTLVWPSCFFSMRKPSTLLSTLVCFWVPLLLVSSFFYATSTLATTEVSGNEVNTDGKLANEELTKTNLEGHNEEAKFKGFFHHKPIFKKRIPIVKPIPKPIPIVKPIPKIIPIVKPIPIPVYKPVPKPIIIKKPIPVFKPIPKPIPIVKPIPKPFIVKKPIPAVEPEAFPIPKHIFKKPIPKPFFKKPIPKPFFKKPPYPPPPSHKPIPTP